MSKYEVLIFARTCGNYQLDNQIVLVKDTQVIAEMVDKGTLTDAQTIVETLTDAQSNGTRPSKILRKDRLQRFYDEQVRNREHIRKTMNLNMSVCRDRYAWLENLSKTALDAKRTTSTAAEIYGCRDFVLGIIEGRGYLLDDNERQALKDEWQNMWDTAFGDLVGQILKMQ